MLERFLHSLELMGYVYFFTANMPNVSEAGAIGQPPRSSDTVASESKILFEMEYVPKNSNPVVVAIFQVI